MKALLLLMACHFNFDSAALCSALFSGLADNRLRLAARHGLDACNVHALADVRHDLTDQSTFT